MLIAKPRRNRLSGMSNDCDAIESTAPDEATPFSVPRMKGVALPADDGGVTATSACALYIGGCISERIDAPAVTTAVISTIHEPCLSSRREHAGRSAAGCGTASRPAMRIMVGAPERADARAVPPGQ